MARAPRIRPYKREAPGLVYVNGRVPRHLLRKYHAALITLDTLLDHLHLKVGHTKAIQRRMRDYRACERVFDDDKAQKAQCIVWAGAFNVHRRMLAERRVHLALRARGAHPVIVPCPGCKVRHHEYYSFRDIGSFDQLERIIRLELGHMGERGSEWHSFLSIAK